MKIANVMVSKVMGGVEQAFLDYNKALSLLNHNVLSIINKKNVVENKIKTPILKIKFNKFNPLLILHLYVALKKFTPDIIIVHHKKAIPLFWIVAKILKVKLIGVAHNPKVKRLEKCDAIFSVTQNQKEEIISNGIKNIPIEVIPNMIATPPNEPLSQPLHHPIIIGAFGRIEPIKGFGDLIDALALLKQKSIPFHAIIGGNNNSSYNEEELYLFQKVKDLNLQKEITFYGWIDDKENFFSQIDIFVLPSLVESFGIVLLEAALAKKALICSDASGPKEVWSNTSAAKIFEKGNIEKLANILAETIIDSEQVKDMGEKAYQYVKEYYSIQAVSKILQNALNKFIK